MAVTTYLDRLCTDLLIKYYFIVKQDPGVMSKEKVVNTAPYATEPSSDTSVATNSNSHNESSSCTSSLLPHVRSGELEVNDIVVVSNMNGEKSNIFTSIVHL